MTGRWYEVNAKMGQQLTLLGLGAMAFYGVMLSSGHLSVEVMPQFLVSALIFLCSGRILRLSARSLRQEDREEETDRPSRPELDWPWLTALLNWSAAMLVVGSMAILLMKPAGVSLQDALGHSFAQEQYFAGAIP